MGPCIPFTGMTSSSLSMVSTAVSPASAISIAESLKKKLQVKDVVARRLPLLLWGEEFPQVTQCAGAGNLGFLLGGPRRLKSSTTPRTPTHNQQPYAGKPIPASGGKFPKWVRSTLDQPAPFRKSLQRPRILKSATPKPEEPSRGATINIKG